MIPEASIIMPTHNSAKTVGESIQSVLNQTFKNWELIITDDCSQDDTSKIVSYFLDMDSRIIFESLSKNCGAAVARNSSIKKAKGRFICFLDSDDIWMPEKLEKQLSFMKEKGVALAYTKYQKFSAGGDGGVVVPPPSVTYKQMIYGNSIGCLTAIYDSKILGKMYMPLIRKRQDWGLWLDILKKCEVAHCLPLVLAKYRVDSGMTKNKFKVLCFQWKFYREVVGLTIFGAASAFVVYAYKGFLKSLI